MGKSKQVKAKVPKKIAGVKVPKKLRKTANRALKLADNPLVRDAAAAALAAGATRLLTSLEAALDDAATKRAKPATGSARNRKSRAAD